jgi:hypothetical protein
MNNYRLLFLATVVLLSLASCLSGRGHVPPTTDLPAKFRESAIEEVENALSSVHRDTQTGQALRAQAKTTQDSLALSIGSYKDGQSSFTEPHAVAAMDKRWIVSDSPSSGRVS